MGDSYGKKLYYILACFWENNLVIGENKFFVRWNDRLGNWDVESIKMV